MDLAVLKEFVSLASPIMKSPIIDRRWGRVFFSGKTIFCRGSVAWLDFCLGDSDFENISLDWNNFRKIVGNKWEPGLNAPFDPIASRLAQRSKMKLALMGKNIGNLRNFLSGKEFKGSVVE